MDKSKTFYLGKITRLHGYKGAMILHLDVDEPSVYYGIDSFFIELNGTLVPHFIERADPRSNQLIIELEGVRGEAAAMGYVNKEAYLPLELLPPLTGNKFYFHEVLGFEVVDQLFGAVGPIERITDHPTNPLFVCMRDGKEVLIPMNDAYLVKVDRSSRQIHVDVPEGLIELYLSGNNERDE